ncbi:hypothetical protein DAPPUDRAFT_97051 [Daphnia pulex]|uniref:Metalloendopeptidase n=1 Tax=Daphnia pulex TaxID=6669 RepID=E9G0F4_DAPPU|nr:hypothetical protein DAPPUDRAFT_97051 [Daphnia pulex]|eukprot:EFX86897.1 hypothetical protein DAPPUDRAFT_97051 [Daphnia pulex]
MSLLDQLLLKVLALSVLLIISTRFESVAAKPVPKNNVSYDDENDDFDIGKPLTEEEFDSGISIKEGEDESENVIPWGRRSAEQFDCDVNTQTGRKNFLSSRERWPDAKIPYEISATYTPEQREIIAFGMKAFHNKTCIRFVRRTTEENYIRIKKTGKGCWSDIGMTSLKQTVSLDDRCILSGAPGVVIHELMHVLGFQHEHQRPDRDKYVSINIDNVDPRSVMHYPANAFAKDTSTPVIIPLKGKPAIGNRRNFSPV